MPLSEQVERNPIVTSEAAPPRSSARQIIAALTRAALDEWVEGLPYVKGEKIIADAEHCDPTYEDAGLTPFFLDEIQYFMSKIESDLKDT